MSQRDTDHLTSRPIVSPHSSTVCQNVAAYKSRNVQWQRYLWHFKERWEKIQILVKHYTFIHKATHSIPLCNTRRSDTTLHKTFTAITTHLQSQHYTFNTMMLHFHYAFCHIYSPLNSNMWNYTYSHTTTHSIQWCDSTNHRLLKEWLDTAMLGVWNLGPSMKMGVYFKNSLWQNN